MKDLFGNEITNDRKLPSRKGKTIGFVWGPRGQSKRDTRARGYAAPPGTGPAGHFCSDCKYAVRVGGHTRRYYKCERIGRRNWTNSYGTDIRIKAPACKYWEPEEQKSALDTDARCAAALARRQSAAAYTTKEQTAAARRKNLQ